MKPKDRLVNMTKRFVSRFVDIFIKVSKQKQIVIPKPF